MVVQQGRHDKREGQTNHPPPKFLFLSGAFPVAGSEQHLTAAALWSLGAMQTEGLYLTR